MKLKRVMMEAILVLILWFIAMLMPAAEAVAEWRIEYSDRLIQEMRKQGYSQPKYYGHYCTKPECQKTLNAISVQGFNVYGNEAICVGCDSPKGGGGGSMPLGGLGGHVSSEQFAKGVAMDIMTTFLSKAIENAINPQQDNAANAAAAYQAQQEALAKKKEQERQERLARLQQMREQSAQQRNNEDDQLTSMLDITGPNGSTGMESTAGGVLGGFDLSIPKIPENELRPRGTANYDTSALSLMDRLRCAAYFSKSASVAAERGDHVNARYLNEQAQKAMLGQITDEECQFSDLPEVPQPSQPQPQETQEQMAFYESMIKSVQEDAKRLQDIEVKLGEADEKIEQAQEEEQQAEQVITEIHNRAASAQTPEEKQECSDLLAQARQVRQEAQQKKQEVTNDKQTYLGEKEEIITKLEDLKKNMQPEQPE